MKVLVLGSGAREHALFWKLMRSPRVEVVYAAPGNAATQSMGAAVDCPATDVEGVLRLVRDRHVDLTVIGPDDAVAVGVADALEDSGRAVFGPTSAAGRVESSKAFAKQLMQEAGIPTAAARVFDDAEAARAHARAQSTGMVVKADGLALGKGVLVCDSVEDTVAAIDRVLVDRAFGESGARIVLEERLSGPELSLMCFCDGVRALPMVPARDFKRAGDGDTGLNTGGMGAYSPPTGVSTAVLGQVLRECAQPLVDALRARDTPYRGCLYVQVMLTADGPRVIEYNARFGDPETQVVLPRLRSDLLAVMLAAAGGNLAEVELDWDPRPTVGVVVASGGYPGVYETGREITGLDRLDDGVLAFHAGTRLTGTTLRTSGGRVLTIVAGGDSVAEARATAYRNADRVRFEGAFTRRDIAAEAG